MGIFMYKCQNGSVPNSITRLYTPVDNIHSYHTRSVDMGNLHIPRLVHSCAQSSLSYTGATLWNEIPIKIRKAKSVETFKEKLREHYSKIQNEN